MPGPRTVTTQLVPRARRSSGRVELGRAARYAVVGVANVAIDFLLFALLVTVGVWYPIAKAISLTVATANGYTLNRLWTFKAGDHNRPMLARYVAVQTSCYLANVALLALLIEVFGRTEIVAQAIALPLIASMSFLAQRLWTFHAIDD